jgi:hypothetical protein
MTWSPQPIAARRPALPRLAAVAAALGLLLTASACIVTPVGYRSGGPPDGSAAYVEPGYASPGEGWMWQVHPSYGWGWHHPDRGWHRGWR